MRLKTPPNSNKGFTLIEVALAVLILGAGLTTLIALHTRYVSAYMTEQRTTQAALYAQYILALREASNKPPELGEHEDPLSERLGAIGFFDGQSLKEKDLNLDGWIVHENVTSVDLPQFPDALRRTDLEVRWGEKEDEGFILTYFAKTPPKENALTQQP